MIWSKTVLVTTIDRHTSITIWLLSNSLMINDISQNGSYHNNWSSHINHKRTFVSNRLTINDGGHTRSYQNNWSSHIKQKRIYQWLTKWAKSDLITTIDHHTSTRKGLRLKFQKETLFLKKTKCQTGNNIPATIFQMKIKNI